MGSLRMWLKEDIGAYAAPIRAMSWLVSSFQISYNGFMIFRDMDLFTRFKYTNRNVFESSEFKEDFNYYSASMICDFLGVTAGVILLLHNLMFCEDDRVNNGRKNPFLHCWLFLTSLHPCVFILDVAVHAFTGNIDGAIIRISHSGIPFLFSLIAMYLIDREDPGVQQESLNCLKCKRKKSEYLKISDEADYSTFNEDIEISL